MEGDDSEASGSGSDAASAASSVPQRKALPQRATRGRRMGRLVGEAAEADAEFWEQAAFKEDETDEDFDESGSGSGSSGSSSTSTDSDIDAPEPVDDDEDEGDVRRVGGSDGAGKGVRAAASRAHDFAEEVYGSKKKSAYVDPALKASKGWTGSLGAAAATAAAVAAKALAASERAGAAGAGAGAGTRAGGGGGAGADAGVGVGVKRPRSDSYAVSAPALRRSGIERVPIPTTSPALNTGPSSRAPPPPSSVPLPTQEEVLREAAHTAIESLRVLDGVARVEAARASKDAADLAAGRGHGHWLSPTRTLVRFHSRRGAADTITFTAVDAVPPLGDATRAGAAPEKPLPALCAVTGRPARYKDPKTGLFYADLAAFKALRK